MAKISIDTSKCQSSVSEMRTLKKQVNGISGQLEEIISSLNLNHADSMTTIIKKLDRENSAILNEALKMDSLADALEHIVKNYSTTEKNNSGYVSEESEGDMESAKSFFSDAFNRLVEWLRKALGVSNVTRQEEQEHDLYMQSTIFALLDTEKYNKKTWSNASIEERKDILNSYLVELAAIFGVKVKTPIKFESMGSSSRGSYNHSKRQIKINQDYLSRADSYQIMQTVIHEMRHAYQHSAVDNPRNFNVSPETIKAWKENFKPGHYKSDGYTYEEYVSQPVEYDAKNFAKQYSDLVNATPEYEGSWA